MSDESDRELEQLQKLDKLRKLVLTILGTHWILLIVVFFLVLAAVTTAVVVSVSYSSSRYVARINLCYLPKQRGKINPYDEKYKSNIEKMSGLNVKKPNLLKSWLSKIDKIAG